MKESEGSWRFCFVAQSYRVDKSIDYKGQSREASIETSVAFLLVVIIATGGSVV